MGCLPGNWDIRAQYSCTLCQLGLRPRGGLDWRVLGALGVPGSDPTQLKKGMRIAPDQRGSESVGARSTAQCCSAQYGTVLYRIV